MALPEWENGQKAFLNRFRRPKSSPARGVGEFWGIFSLVLGVGRQKYLFGS